MPASSPPWADSTAIAVGCGVSSVLVSKTTTPPVVLSQVAPRCRPIQRLGCSALVAVRGFVARSRDALLASSSASVFAPGLPLLPALGLRQDIAARNCRIT